MDITLNLGNVNGSVAFYGLYDRLIDRNSKIKAVVNNAECKNCFSINSCTKEFKLKKAVAGHIWSDNLVTIEDIRHTPEYKKLYKR